MPRVSFNIAVDEAAQFGELSIATLGYGLQQAWVYATMFDALTIFGESASVAKSIGIGVQLPFFTSVLTFGITLILFALLSTAKSNVRHIFFSKKCLAVFTVMFSAGTALLLLTGALPELAVLFQVISGFLTGVGTAYYLVSWGAVFSHMDNNSIVLNGALSIVVAFTIYVFVLQQLPYPFGAVLGILIPVAEMMLLTKAYEHGPEAEKHNEEAERYLPVKFGPFVAKFGVPVFLLGVVLGILRQTTTTYVQPMENISLLTIVFLTACIATSFIVIMYITFGNNGKWNSLFKMMMPFVALAVFCVPLADRGGALSWTMLIVITGYMLFEAMLWIFFAQIAQQFNLSPILTYGIGRGLAALAALAGAYYAMLDTVALWDLHASIKMSFMLVVLVLAYVILPERRDFLMMREGAERMSKLAYEQIEGVAFEDDEMALLEGAAGRAGAGVGAGAGAGSGGAGAGAGAVDSGAGAAAAGAGAGASGARAVGAGGVAAGLAGGDSASQTAGSGAGCAACPAATASGCMRGTSAAGAGNGGAPSPVPVPAPAGADAGAMTAGTATPANTVAPEGTFSYERAYCTHGTMDGTEMIGQALPQDPERGAGEVMLGEARTPQGAVAAYTMGGGANAAGSAPSAAQEQAAADQLDLARFRAQLDCVANTYLLSRREADVLLYLARGYKAAYIQEKLYIAEGTAKTHIRHIYRKLNVHSQQELMRLVDSTEV